MAIFNREKSVTDSTQTSRPRPMERQIPESKKRNATYIAPGSKVSGEITGATEVLVDGHFEGRLHLDSILRVGGEGQVHGEVKAQSVRVEGKVFGNVWGTDRVEVTSSGALEGDISAARVIIAEGAFFKGKVEMRGEKTQTNSAKSAPQKTSSTPSTM